MSQLTLTFPAARDLDSPIAVALEGEVAEYLQIWIWDLFYARVLHAIADTSEAEELRERLDVWAVNMSTKIYQPFDHIRAKGHLTIDPAIEIGEPHPPGPTVEVTIEGGGEQMPTLDVGFPPDLSTRRKAASVTALAQYFIGANELFAKELPVHVLAFRKYYADIQPPTDPESVEAAPLHAMQKALEFFQSMSGSQPGEQH